MVSHLRQWEAGQGRRRAAPHQFVAGMAADAQLFLRVGSSGMDAFLRKPVSKVRLLALLRDLDADPAALVQRGRAQGGGVGFGNGPGKAGSSRPT